MLEGNWKVSPAASTEVTTISFRELHREPGVLPGAVHSQEPPPPVGDEEASGTFSVGLSTGRATVTIPKGVTDADLAALVRTILNRRR